MEREVHIAPSTNDADWWRQAVVYQIYPRSFFDSDGDGLGDLKGITVKVPYLKTLGIDAVWLSPFYPSALADGGYDVDDYRNVDPRLGDLDDFDALAAALHAHGLRIVVDIVPNHTSNRHIWFREALTAATGSDARERYIFRDGKGPDGAEPPNDWESYFGGPAWTRLPDGQWYFHLFAPEQPDLNWERRDVRDEFLTTLRFWADRGVDGFRIDVANLLVKDLSDPMPSFAELAGLTDGVHPFDDRDEVHEIYAEWRELFNRYDPPRCAVAEAWVPAHRIPRFASPSGLGQAFNFDLLSAPWNAPAFRSIITTNLDLAARSGSSSTWVLSNHDTVRHATRYGAARPGGLPGGAPAPDGQVAGLGTDPRVVVDHELGAQRARAAILLLMALPGAAYLYQGEELGLFEVLEIAPEQRQDPRFFRTKGALIGRDGCRVPLPWSQEAPAFGFSTTTPHLPQPAWFADMSVEKEAADAASNLTLYRSALRLRAELQTTERLHWVESDPDLVHFARPGGWRSMTNFGKEPVALPTGDIHLASSDVSDGHLPGNTTIWYRV